MLECVQSESKCSDAARNSLHLQVARLMDRRLASPRSCCVVETNMHTWVATHTPVEWDYDPN